MEDLSQSCSCREVPRGREERLGLESAADSGIRAADLANGQSHQDDRRHGIEAAARLVMRL